MHRRVLEKQPASGECKYFSISAATTRLAMPTSDVLVSCCNRHHASSEQRLNQPGVHQWGVRARPRPVSGSILQQYATEGGVDVFTLLHAQSVVVGEGMIAARRATPEMMLVLHQGLCQKKQGRETDTLIKEL